MNISENAANTGAKKSKRRKTQIVKGNYTTNDLMALFCVGRSTLYDLIARGEIKPPCKIGRTSFWPREEIDALIEERKQAREEAA